MTSPQPQASPEPSFESGVYRSRRGDLVVHLPALHSPTWTVINSPGKPGTIDFLRIYLGSPDADTGYIFLLYFDLEGSARSVAPEALLPGVIHLQADMLKGGLGLIPTGPVEAASYPSGKGSRMPMGGKVNESSTFGEVIALAEGKTAVGLIVFGVVGVEEQIEGLKKRLLGGCIQMGSAVAKVPGGDEGSPSLPSGGPGADTSLGTPSGGGSSFDSIPLYGDGSFSVGISSAGESAKLQEVPYSGLWLLHSLPNAATSPRRAVGRDKEVFFI